MLSKKMIYGFISSLFLMSFSVSAADLNEILKSGEVKIAVPCLLYTSDAADE